MTRQSFKAERREERTGGKKEELEIKGQTLIWGKR